MTSAPSVAFAVFSLAFHLSHNLFSRASSVRLPLPFITQTTCILRHGSSATYLPIFRIFLPIFLAACVIHPPALTVDAAFCDTKAHPGAWWDSVSDTCSSRCMLHRWCFLIPDIPVKYWVLLVSRINSCLYLSTCNSFCLRTFVVSILSSTRCRFLRRPSTPSGLMGFGVRYAQFQV